MVVPPGAGRVTGPIISCRDRLQAVPNSALTTPTGLPCTRHRVFLATLICAAKYLNDSSPKNKHWCRYAQMLSQPEVNLMEKQLLFLLDYDLAITEDEICHYARPFLEQYTFEPEIPVTPATPPMTPPDQPLPVTPRLPSGETVKAAAAAAHPQPAYYYNPYDSADEEELMAPPCLDRSDSTSSIGSDGPVTPASSQCSPVHSRRPDVGIADAHTSLSPAAVPSTKDARQYVRRLFSRRTSSVTA